MVFCWKIELVFIWVFWYNQVRKDGFFFILDRNERFLDQKGNVLRSAKKSTFSLKVSPWFFPKFKLFLTSVFDILDKKE